MSAAASHDRTHPVHLILKDSTLVLFWPMTADSVMQFADDFQTCEVANTTFDGIILDKNAKDIPNFTGATFELDGNAYVIEQANLGTDHQKLKYLTRVNVTASTYFPQ
jgi:hypothetical protein